jgi:hypothetical protein
MSLTASLATIILAALIHSSFQLSVSVLTLLSGHSIGLEHSHKKLLGLTTSFILGACLIVLLLISALAFITSGIFFDGITQAVWAGSCGLLLGVAASVWIFYYRREKGTALWVPRGMAKYLTDRTKTTKAKAEAFSLGVSSVLGEILFIIAPLIVGGLTIAQLPLIWQLTGAMIYTLVSMSSLIIIWALIGGGHTLGRIQRWREDNKYFLQFISGAGLIILSVFVYINTVVSSVSGGLL